MPTTPPVEAPLSPRWAFVVPLREVTALTAEALHGRVEPLVSGQAVQTLATLDTPEASRALVAAAVDPSALVRQAVPAARPPAP
jgi:hypothetical protein